MTNTLQTTSRSAHATIRGYWWQFIVSCIRWCGLEDGEYLICEGIEDIDIHRLPNAQGRARSVIYEQLKDYQSQGISAGNKSGREVLANFVSKYVEETKAGRLAEFKLVTTAKLSKQQGDVDVVAEWQKIEAAADLSEEFLKAARDAINNAIEDIKRKSSTSPRIPQIQEALDWLDEEETNVRWFGFLKAVTWEFECDGITTSFDKLLETLDAFDFIEFPRQTANRLLFELIHNVSLGGDENQCFDRTRFEAICTETKEELEAWATTHEPTLVIMNKLLELSLTNAAFTEEKLGELGAAFDKTNELLRKLVEHGLLPGAPFGLPSSTPVWDALDLHTRAVLETYSPIKINNHQPISRASVDELISEFAEEREHKLLILEGKGGSGKSTALVTCAKHVLEDDDSVVLLLNLAQIRSGRKLTELVDNAPERTPDLLLFEALGETGRSRGVLIIDQLDKLSRVSASSEDDRAYFDKIKLLIMRTLQHDSLRVLVACRSFDGETDDRMKALNEHERCKRFVLGPLEEDDVLRVVGGLGYSSALSPSQLQYLSVPLHLHLLAGLESAREGDEVPIDEYNLYQNFWDEKRRKLRHRLANWGTLHNKICSVFHEKKRRFFKDRDLDDEFEAIEVLVSEDILRVNGKRYSYFHQSFEEYVFARCFDGNLADYVQEEGGSFFALDQTKAILIERRNQDELRYFEDLHALIFGEFDPPYRWLVRLMLMEQTDLIDEELAVWCEMVASGNEFIEWQAFEALDKNPAFVRAFEARGWLEEIFAQRTCNGEAWQENIHARVCRLLLQHILDQRPEEGASWFSRLVEDERNFSWLRGALTKEHYYGNRAVFDAFLESIEADLWEPKSSDWILVYTYALPATNHEWVPEVIAACMRHNLSKLNENALTPTLEYEDYSNDRGAVFSLLVDVDVFGALPKHAPDEVIEHFAPLLPELLERFESPSRIGWLWWFGSSYLEPEGVWLSALFDALDACTDPSVLCDAADIGASLPDTSSDARLIRWRLLRVGGLDHLRQATGELEAWIDSHEHLQQLPDGNATIGMLLRTAAEQLPPDEWTRLLERLLAYQLTDDEGAPDASSRDHILRLLLRELPPDSLTEDARAVLERLEEQFTASREDDEEAPLQDLETMSADQVVEYMRGAPSRVIRATLGLASLQFIKTLADVYDDVPQGAKNDIIYGWYDALKVRTDPALFEELWPHMYPLVRHIYDEQPESRHPIARLLELCGEFHVEDVIDMAVHIMLEHPDPSSSFSSTPRGLFQSGINCVRGRMAELLGSWIQGSEVVFNRTRDAVEQACQDTAPQVRSCVIFPLLMSLKYDPGFAVTQYLGLVNDQPDELLATRYSREFLRCTINRYLVEMGPVIERMLESDSEDVRRAGGVAFGLSTFASSERLERIEVLSEDDDIARGIAEVWKENISSLSDEQRNVLASFFDHSCDDVLKEIGGIFFKMEKTWFLEHATLLELYLDSRIIRIQVRQMLAVFKRWKLSESHPEVVLRVIGKLVDIYIESRAEQPYKHLQIEHKICPMLSEIHQQHVGSRQRVIKLLNQLAILNVRMATTTLEEIVNSEKTARG